MQVLNIFEKLKNSTQEILSDQINYLKLKNAAEDLKSLFNELSELNIDADGFEQSVFLDTGEAIGLKWAGRCVDDLMRTRAFIRGLKRSIDEVKEKTPGKPACVLYCGTGPFATLVVPLITVFTPNELQLVLLEINPVSVESIKKIFKKLGAEDYIIEIHQVDAAKFAIPNSEEIDILVLECMQIALAKEQQVAITHNLYSQLKPEAILIPEEISLHLALVDGRAKMATFDAIVMGDIVYHKNSEPLFVLNKEEVRSNAKVFKQEGISFPKKKTLLPKAFSNNPCMIAITTEIKVYKEDILTIDESSLTAPLRLGHQDEQPNTIGITSQFLVNELPGLEIDFIE